MSELSSAFRRSIDEGEHRLSRSWTALFATGAVGGIDVSVGVLALLLVEEATGSSLLGGLAFGIGFIASGNRPSQRRCWAAPSSR